MEEPDLETLGTRAGRLVHKRNALRLRPAQGGGRVIDGEGDVMQPLPPLGKKTGDGTVGGGGFQQLDLRLADPEERRADLLVGHLFDGIARCSEELLEDRDRIRKTPDGDADVFDVCWGHGLQGDVFAVFPEDGS